MNRQRAHPGRVSLMIKGCAQDADHTYRLVSHILAQLEGTDFVERFMVVDPRRQDFLRPYNPPNSEKLHQVLEQLVAEKKLDCWWQASSNPALIRERYRRWFGCNTAATHSEKGVPISPQLEGFERAQGDYLLQADIDVMIVRRDPEHDFLSDMLFALDADPNCISVSFNIAHGHAAYVPYFAPPGGYVPEVRFCLLDRRKLFALLPLPNEVGPSGKLLFPWYRSLQQKQHQTGVVSLRGGDGRTFFIHPMNTVKQDHHLWMQILKQVEQDHIPAVQYEHWDLVEDRQAWTTCQEDAYERGIWTAAELLNWVFTPWQAETGLLILRHGTKIDTPPEISAESRDTVGLSAEGIRQVQEFAARLPCRPHTILTAPLPRCSQTAAWIAKTVGGTVRILELPELLGAPFSQRALWQLGKQRFGWSQWVSRWIHGQVERSLTVPYHEWLPEALAAIQTHRASNGWTLVITQGYLNSAFCYFLTGRLEYRGGPLYGFIWPYHRL